jgi:hypothetical protein
MTNANENNNNNNNKNQNQNQNQYTDVAYIVDTLGVDDKTNLAAYANFNKNTITVNYKSETGNELGMEALIHEKKHQDNFRTGNKNLAVSLEQAYKLDMHDEISANMAHLIALRQEYLQTGDISVFDKFDGRFSYYKEAIQNGTINPQSPYKEDFDAEMKFIANETQNMWMKNWSAFYISQNYINATLTCDRGGTKSAYYDENYEKAVKNCYTIGGVDFSQYLQHDVEVPEGVWEEADKYKEIFDKYAEKTLADSRKECEENGMLSDKKAEAYNNDLPLINNNKSDWGDSWSPEHRVSEVQYVKMIDLSKPILVRPTLSKYGKKENAKDDSKQKVKQVMQNDHKNAMQACSTTEKDNVNDKSNYVTPNDNTYVAQPKTVEKVAINSAKSNKSQQQVNTPQFLKTLEIMRSR